VLCELKSDALPVQNHTTEYIGHGQQVGCLLNLAVLLNMLAQEETVPIRVSLRAVFSKYAITPARGIHFGPHTYSTTSKPRVFDITNMGEWWGACMDVTCGANLDVCECVRPLWELLYALAVINE